MRRKARKCPLCGDRLTGKRGMPKSKHLDHIIPICVGGTHTHGNVRIICADCNLRRPKDGSDVTGQVTLWAQGPSPVRRTDGRRGRIVNRTTCRKGLHPWVPENIRVHGGKNRCRPCDNASSKRRGDHRRAPLQGCKCGKQFAAAGNTFMCPDCIESAGRKAAELHADGMTWKEVAAEVGYGSHNGEGARYAAKRIGYAPEPKPPKAGPAQCQCAAPAWRKGRCKECIDSAAQRAVQLRREGWTLRMIADEIGYDSISSVTNLISAVVPVKRYSRSLTG